MMPCPTCGIPIADHDEGRAMVCYEMYRLQAAWWRRRKLDEWFPKGHSERIAPTHPVRVSR